ncbi:ORF59 protein [Operophtera brumata nucleopolyhedrovirus]|uniref:ORF59 protein n=1 Tax=Operophtera brumata nucleopolyhedrovirus TaxID=1046267 RepID=A0A2H4UZT8_9ABAC|nr:ORF59 protein [Operophtera brumata nucleopolyhedrovirus]AUA60290.1 ORF59 protein [Operophtera brumata nucleopolyhedrovirus]
MTISLFAVRASAHVQIIMRVPMQSQKKQDGAKQHFNKFRKLQDGHKCFKCSEPADSVYYHRFECSHIFCARCVRTIAKTDYKQFLQTYCAVCDPNPAIFSRQWEMTVESNVPYYHMLDFDRIMWRLAFPEYSDDVCIQFFTEYNCRILLDL